MADVKEATVEVEDEGVVTIDVSDKPELAEVEGVEGKDPIVKTAEAEPEPPKKPLPRVRLKEAAKPVAEADATVALQTAVKNAEDARKAAEATALAERSRADAATRALQTQTQETQQLRETVEDRELSILTSGIDSATREVAAYQDELTRALEGGEFAKVSAVQAKMSKAAAALDRLEAAKADYTAGRKTTEGRVEAPAAAQPAAPSFETYVGGFSPRAQAWLRAHPDCAPPTVGGNAAANAKMMSGHWAALGAGLQEGSDAYFNKIEEFTGHRAPTSAAAETVEAGEEEAPVVQPKKAAPKIQPSAPPSRDPPTANGIPRTTRQVTLTKEQQEAAKISFPQLPPNQAFANYARNLLELEAEGKMGRLTH